MNDLSKTCLKCGLTFIGSHDCPDLLKSDYDKGLEAGKRSAPSYFPWELPPINLSKTCYKCGQTYIGSHACLDLYRSDWKRGYEAGKQSARREMGFSGTNEFHSTGE